MEFKKFIAGNVEYEVDLGTSEKLAEELLITTEEGSLIM
jgi:hypothetical protein